VCINSDASVARLKGPSRPVVRQEDRSAVLMGLTAVDAVVTFDEPTPERVLSDLQPDIWVKGADYAVADLPEAPLLASWGGQAVVLPYLDGRSTTALIREAVRHARH
jgi:rfaE bifunctional protein nucleotidyltransferase chain/domain